MYFGELVLKLAQACNFSAEERWTDPLRGARLSLSCNCSPPPRWRGLMGQLSPGLSYKRSLLGQELLEGYMRDESM